MSSRLTFLSFCFSSEPWTSNPKIKQWIQSFGMQFNRIRLEPPRWLNLPFSKFNNSGIIEDVPESKKGHIFSMHCICKLRAIDTKLRELIEHFWCIQRLLHIIPLLFLEISNLHVLSQVELHPFYKKWVKLEAETFIPWARRIAARNSESFGFPKAISSCVTGGDGKSPEIPNRCLCLATGRFSRAVEAAGQFEERFPKT